MIVVNGKTLSIKNITAQNLIKQLGYENQRIALEVNKAIIPRSQYVDFVLNDGDVCEIIKAVGGG